MAVTGDAAVYTARNKEGVTLHNFPLVLKTSLSDKTASINIKTESGKRLGAQVIGVDSITSPTIATLFVAAGSADTDKWVLVKDIVGTGGATVTPA